MALAACHKADNSPTIDFGPGDGITHRAADGTLNGSLDSTDWSSDAAWNEQELALFSDLKFDINGPPQQPQWIQRTYLYPNPAGQARWDVQYATAAPASPNFSIALALVNQHYQLLTRPVPNSFFHYTIFFDFTKLNINRGEKYRLYYVFYNNSGLVYKGHGDIHYLD
ncbi:hypothetical protein A0257_09930 [Hymenobacter psoromatis]|nr:hypothetical protein A0257_09930 [Hymenobacter psoromatis]